MGGSCTISIGDPEDKKRLLTGVVLRDLERANGGQGVGNGMQGFNSRQKGLEEVKLSLV
jgi:hypothetical protein